MDLAARVARSTEAREHTGPIGTGAGGGHPMLALQRAAGNAAVSRLLARDETEGEGEEGAGHDGGLADLDGWDDGTIEALAADGWAGAYALLHDRFHQNWHFVKEHLFTQAPPETKAKRRQILAKLLEYRDWHHQQILAEVREHLGAEGLAPSGGAGSTGATSDIDVNLKGNRTEEAVALFNQAFKAPQSPGLAAHRWDREAGVVYDVNVYALDFMLGAPQKQGELNVTVKEQGGPTTDFSQRRDRADQLATSLFKARLYMTQAQFEGYRDSSVQGVADPGEMLLAFERAVERYEGYLIEMSDRMGVRLDDAVDEAEAGVKRLQDAAERALPAQEGENPHATDARRQDLLMSSANRIYEEKLGDIRTKRGKIKDLVEQRKKVADPGTIDDLIDFEVTRLRAAVSDAAKYANEASITDAGVHHGVYGTQLGKQINQQKHEGVEALNEHVADLHKETYHYEGFEAVYKAGKYLLRFGDAARNMGFGYVHGVADIYDAGFKISGEVKSRASKDEQYDSAGATREAIEGQLGFTEVEPLLALVRETAALILQEYQGERSAERGEGGHGDTAPAPGFATPAKGQANTHFGNQDMTHPADRGSEDRTATYAEEVGTEDEALWRFRLTPEERRALEEQWAQNIKAG